MAMIRNNDLNYTAEEAEKTSKGYAMQFIEKLKSELNKCVDDYFGEGGEWDKLEETVARRISNLQKRINDGLSSQGNRITDISIDISKINKGKADKATTLEGYGITDAYKKAETDNAISEKVAPLETELREKDNELSKSIGEVREVAGENTVLLGNKADKATTLSGYGITDAYTKAETDNAISEKVAPLETELREKDNELSKSIGEVREVAGENTVLLGNKADKATTLSGYGITDAYTKAETDDLLSNYKKNDFIITIIDEREVDGEMIYGADKTFNEALNAYKEGKTLYFLVSSSNLSSEEDLYDILLPAHTITENEIVGGIGPFEISCYRDNTIIMNNNYHEKIENKNYEIDEERDYQAVDEYPNVPAVIKYVNSKIQNVDLTEYYTKTEAEKLFADKPTVITSITNDTLTLENNQEANLGNISELHVFLPEVIDDYYQSNFSFTTEELFQFDSHYRVFYCGDDCNSDGVFMPQSNTNYEVSVKRLGDKIERMEIGKEDGTIETLETVVPNLVARVGAY